MTLEEAIKVLRQHNVKGASVLRITGGQALEKDLLEQVLDSCEQLISEKAEYKRLLKAAVEDCKEMLPYTYSCNSCALSKDDGHECSNSSLHCADKCKWRYADEVKELIND